MREMTKEEAELAAALFASTEMPPPHKGEGTEYLTVRFDSTVPGVVYWGPHARKRKVRMPGATVLSFSVDSRSKVQSLLVRTKDGRRWNGSSRAGTDVIVLRRKEEK